MICAAFQLNGGRQSDYDSVLAAGPKAEAAYNDLVRIKNSTYAPLPRHVQQARCEEPIRTRVSGFDWEGVANRSAFPDDFIRVFLLAGQSNMEGSDAPANRIDEFPEFRGAGATQDNVLYAYCLPAGDRGWGPLHPLESFGPEITFARRLSQHVQSPIAIIKSAVGGTTVFYDWSPHAPEEGQKLYPRTLRLLRESLQDLDARGLRYRLEGVLWHQGENDMLNLSLCMQYAEGLTRLIAQLRHDLNAPQLKWYLGEVSEKGIWGMDHRGNLGMLYEQQQLVLKSDPLLRWVPTSHLAFEVMESGQPHYHFGAQGQLGLGCSFAQAYLLDIGRWPAPRDRRFRHGLPVAEHGRIRLFVMAGQRNVEGEDSFVSEIADEPGFECLMRDQDQVLYRYSLGGGVAASADWEPLGPTGCNFGPELSFGARLRKSITIDGIAIVKFTHSGAQMPDWLPDGSPESHRDLYPRFIDSVRAARDDLTRQGYECILECVVWHAGENDTYFGPYARRYAEWMKQLIDRVRVDLNRANLRWFISEQHPNAPWRNQKTVNSGLNELAASERHVKVLSVSHLSHGPRHFGTRGTLWLGEEMANAYLKEP